jgi:hypothetical protein
VRRERQEAGQQLDGLGTTRESGQAVSNDPGPGCGWACKNGKRCRYRKTEKCRFVHPDEKCPGCEVLGGHEYVHNQGKRTRVSRVRVRVRVPEHALEHATLPPEHAPNLRVFGEEGYMYAYI